MKKFEHKLEYNSMSDSARKLVLPLKGRRSSLVYNVNFTYNRHPRIKVVLVFESN